LSNYLNEFLIEMILQDKALERGDGSAQNVLLWWAVAVLYDVGEQIKNLFLFIKRMIEGEDV
jgi:hypothetical protein